MLKQSEQVVKVSNAFNDRSMYVDTVDTIELHCGILYKVFELHETNTNQTKLEIPL